MLISLFILFMKRKLIRFYCLANIYIVYSNRTFILMKFMFFNFSTIKFYNFSSIFICSSNFFKSFLNLNLYTQNWFFKRNISNNYKKAFFSFYNIFCYTWQAFVFHLLRDFCNVYNHIVAFFSCTCLERFWYLSQAFFCSLSLLFW